MADCHIQDMSTFGERLAEARKDAGWNQQKLADETGASQPTIAKYEKDWRRPHPNDGFERRAADKLNVNLLWLMLEMGPKRGNAKMDDQEYWKMLGILPEEDREAVFHMIRTFYRKVVAPGAAATPDPQKRGKM